jgi:hypothetical protein
VYDNWLTAESKGRYLHQAVIGYFPYERLRPRRRQPAPEETESAEASTETLTTNEHADTTGDNTTLEENATP